MWLKIMVPVILLPMLFHSVAGCCWHHSHSHFSDQFSLRDAEDHVDHRHEICHGHAGHLHMGHGIPVDPSPEKEHEPCDKLHCVYVGVADARKTDANQWVVPGMNSEIGHTIPLNVRFWVTYCRHRKHQAVGTQQHCALYQVWII